MYLAEFSMSPLGKGESVAPYVARCLECIERSGLEYELHAMGTIVEGEWGEIACLLEDCFQALQKDCDRVSCSVKLDYRKGASGRIRSKVLSVEKLAGHPLNTGHRA